MIDRRPHYFYERYESCGKLANQNVMIKKTGLMIVMLLTIVLAGQAQDTEKVKKERWDAASKADKMSDKLYRELDLTKEQNQQIHAINNDIARRRDAARRDTTLDARRKMQLRQQLDAERSNRFKSVLTPAQYKKWNDWELQKKEQLEAKMDRKQDKKQARKANR
jgi:Spy/CpxP family protein refolding chaperone